MCCWLVTLGVKRKIQSRKMYILMQNTNIPDESWTMIPQTYIKKVNSEKKYRWSLRRVCFTPVGVNVLVYVEILYTGIFVKLYEFILCQRLLSPHLKCVSFSGGPLSALTCCVNVRLLSAIKKISPLIYSQSWVGSWVYTTQAMMSFTLIF